MPIAKNMLSVRLQVLKKLDYALDFHCRYCVNFKTSKNSDSNNCEGCEIYKLLEKIEKTLSDTLTNVKEDVKMHKKKVRMNDRKSRYADLTDEQKEIAKQNGLNQNIVNLRLRRGRTIEEAITKPRERKHQKRSEQHV